MNAACHCGREATHTVSNGELTVRVCHLHARKAAIQLRELSKPAPH